MSWAGEPLTTALPRTAIRTLLHAGDISALSSARSADEPPLTTPRDPAREAARRELSKRMYHENDPSLFQRALDAFWDWLDKLFDAASSATPGGALGLIVIILAVVAILGALWWRLGTPRRQPTSSAALFDDRPRSAADHRAAAEAHAAQGHWNQAARNACGPSSAPWRNAPSWTSARAAPPTRPRPKPAASLPAHTDRLRAAARDFDDVTYGGRSATEQSYHRIAELDRDLEHTKPRLATSSTHSTAPDTRQGAAE